MSEEIELELESLSDEVQEALLNAARYNTAWDGSLPFHGPDTRSVLVMGTIEDTLAAHICAQLYELEHLDPHAPIYVHVHTEGGSVFDALAIYDVLRSISCPIITCVRGLCASAGLIICAAGDIRIGAPHSFFFYHQTQMNQVDISSQEIMYSTTQLYDMLNDRFDTLLKQRIGLTEEEWQNLFHGKTSKWFDVDTAVEYKLIHHVIEPKQKPKIKLCRESGAIEVEDMTWQNEDEAPE